MPSYSTDIVGKKLSHKKLELVRRLNYLPIKPKDIFYRYNLFKFKRFNGYILKEPVKSPIPVDFTE